MRAARLDQGNTQLPPRKKISTVLCHGGAVPLDTTGGITTGGVAAGGIVSSVICHRLNTLKPSFGDGGGRGGGDVVVVVAVRTWTRVWGSVRTTIVTSKMVTGQRLVRWGMEMRNRGIGLGNRIGHWAIIGLWGAFP